MVSEFVSGPTFGLTHVANLASILTGTSWPNGLVVSSVSMSSSPFKPSEETLSNVRAWPAAANAIARGDRMRGQSQHVPW